LRQSLASLFILAAAALAGSGCADYKVRTADARQAFYTGDFARSAQVYEEKGRDQGRDRLLYYLDTGMAHHAAKQYAQSNEWFAKADALIEDLNFSPGAGSQALAVLTDDRARPYVGEEFEDVLVNALAALNYLLAGGPKAAEEALIECRRLDWKLREFAELRKRQYLQNAFARYLSGAAYEMDGEPNDAYIDYKTVHKLRPDFEPVRRDLVRLARRLGFGDEADAWEKQFGLKFDPAAAAGTGEVLVVYQCGRAPVKVQREELLDLPIYQKQRFLERSAELAVGGETLARTEVLEDIEATAIRTLEDRLGPIVARRLASLGVKTAAAVGVRQVVKKQTHDSGLADLLGVLTFELLKAVDKADTRSWLTLPASLQVARVRLPAGTHTVEVRFLDAGGNPTGHHAEFSGVPVRPGRITVLDVRSLR
jgi:uncharacterized protein